MSKRIDHAQAFCYRCQRATLHQRSVTETNHVLHLLLTLFCCLLWVPVWLLAAIVNSLENPPYLCTQCGQTAGQLTPEQLAAMAKQAAIERQRVAAEKAEASAQKAEASAQKAEASAQKAEAAAEGRERRAELFAQIGSAVLTGTAATIEELKRLPKRTDQVLRIVAGEENDIIFWFLRVVTVILTVGLTIGILASLVSVIISLF